MSTPKVDPSIAAFFSDPNGSSIVSAKASQIVAPMVRGEDVQPSELAMGGGIRIVFYILDRSPSMDPVGAMLLNDFNNELVPAIREARADDTSVLRIGGLSFSTDITPIWMGKDDQGQPCYFHSLFKLPALTTVDYNPPDGWGTALHAAIIDGTARAMKFGADQQAKMGTAPDIDIIILTDGNNNDNPRDPAVVKTMIEGSNRTQVRFTFFYFETEGGLKDPKGYAINELGIDPENVQVFAARPGESVADRRKRFRRMMRVMSRVSASKGTSAVQAAAAVPATDDDIV